MKVPAPKKSPVVQEERGGDSTTPNPQDEVRRSAVTPNTPSILSRPYPTLSGRRIVPHLICTNGVPFLQYKKPQPPTLSRVINDKIRAHGRRLDRKLEYQNQVQMGKMEDAWDNDLSQYCGLSSKTELDLSWKSEHLHAMHELLKVSRRHGERNRKMALDMYHVMEKERALAEKEKHTGRDERHRRNKAKRLARREAEQGEGLDLGEPALAETERLTGRDERHRRNKAKRLARREAE